MSTWNATPAIAPPNARMVVALQKYAKAGCCRMSRARCVLGASVASSRMRQSYRPGEAPPSIELT